MSDKDITAMSIDEISQRISEIVSEFTALDLNSESSDEDITKAEELAAEVRALREERESRLNAAAEKEERLSSITDAFQVEEEPEVEASTETSEEEPEIEASTEEEQNSESDAEVVDLVEEAPEPVAEDVAEPVAAAVENKISPAKKAAAFAPEVKMPKSSSAAVITAAADVPGFPNGQELDGLTAAAEALVSRMRGMPTTPTAQSYQRYGAAVVRMPGQDGLIQDGVDDFGLVQRAGDESRLPGGSLTAAGGWCAPSETLYDLLSTESTDGLLQLPEFQVTRGGIRYTPGPDFSTIYTDCLFHQTEAEAIAGTAKGSCEVTCPSFTDVRMNVVGTAIMAPILTNAAYPELTRRYIEAALVAVQHRVNAEVIADMVAAGGAALTPADQGTLAFTMDYLEWQAMSMRYAYRLAASRTIEVVAPLWLKPLFRAELGRRTGVEAWAVSDAQLNEYFSVRGLAVQFVYGKDDLTSYPTLEAVPASVDVTMYPSGTWSKGTADVINLDAVYDATNLDTNVYTAVFAEWGYLAVQRSTSTINVTLPIDVKGLSAAATADVSLGSAVV